MVTLLLTLPTTQASSRLGRPTAEQLRLFTAIYWLGELVVALIGLALLAWLWHRAGREPLTGPTSEGGASVGQPVSVPASSPASASDDGLIGTALEAR